MRPCYLAIVPNVDWRVQLAVLGLASACGSLDLPAPPQLVLHLSTLRERPLTDAFPGRAQVQSLLAAVAGQLRALQVVQRHHVVHESAGGLFGDAEEFAQA